MRLVGRSVTAFVRLAAIAAATLTIPSLATAWEADGLASGMSVDEAVAALAAGGVELIGPADPTGLSTTFFSRALTEPRVSLHFCRGRLTEYRVSIDGGLRAFAVAAGALIGERGRPQMFDARTDPPSNRVVLTAE